MRAGFKPTPVKRRLAGGSPAMHAGVVNGSPALIAALDDRVLGVVILDLRDDKVAVVRGISDPDRLGRLTAQWRRCRHDDPLIDVW
jgi:RNA polymerase sigma-70 factor (ECF subfamily)